MTEIRKADLELSLVWQGGQRFAGTSGHSSITLDGKREAGPSPVQAVAFALAACMSIDVVDMLEKGRLSVKALRSGLRAFRAKETPHQITGIELHLVVTGEVPGDRIERAIELSREKYCSVWHSLNPSIDFKTSFAVNP